MTGLEIFLIIIGFACICISFFVSKKRDTEGEGDSAVQSSEIWSEKEEQMIRDRINDILSDFQNELVDSTQDQMNQLCNDKIMAVDEFSKQLLEKIKSNHQEVVFMYNMLNEKQKEIKTIMQEPVKLPEPSSASVKVEEPPKVVVERTQPREVVENKVTSTNIVAEEPKQTPKAVTSKKEQRSSIPGNVNLQIQKLYKQGKSVLEISKELDIGQGEVKLVIALYGGKR